MNVVTFVFPSDGNNRTGILRMEWREGWTVRRYLHEPPLRHQGLLGLWKRCKVRNQAQTRVRLHYTPPPDDVVVMVRAGRPMS